MIKEVTLASSSGIRLKILEDNNFNVKQQIDKLNIDLNMTKRQF